MEVILEQSFLKSAKKLPIEAKQKLSRLVGLLEANAYHPLLHTKKAHWQHGRIFFFSNYPRLAGYFLF